VNIEEIMILVLFNDVDSIIGATVGSLFFIL